MDQQQQQQEEYHLVQTIQSSGKIIKTLINLLNKTNRFLVWK
jgi:hypothetical protein